MKLELLYAMGHNSEARILAYCEIETKHFGLSNQLWPMHGPVWNAIGGTHLIQTAGREILEFPLDSHLPLDSPGASPPNARGKA